MSTTVLDTNAALQRKLLRMGDNTLILGQRISEWCGHAPVLEEDIAMANVALDLIGQTQFWLGLAAELGGEGKTADDLAYLRDSPEIYNFLLVELPNGDYAQTLTRQFFFDAWHFLQLRALMESANSEVADIAAKAFKEVSYQLERTTDLFVRLGDGTEESNARMQEAVDNVWSYTGEMFTNDEYDEALVEPGIAPLPSSLHDEWLAYVTAKMKEATLNIPESTYMHKGGRQGRHTEHLGFILAEMQFLQRAYPGCTW